MNTPVAKFVTISISSLVMGAGLGVVVAWCMTIRLERQYQMAITEGGSALGAALGLFLGLIAYYGIFRQQIRFETFCATLAVTAVATAVTAYLLHRLTDTGGWLSIFMAVGTFLFVSVQLRDSE